MSVLTRLRPALLVAAIAAAAPAAFCAEAAAAPAAPEASSGFSDRLFLAFATDAALVKSQWWEAQVEYADGSSGVPANVFQFRGVVAFRPIKNLEVGGHVGFGTSNASGDLPDGTGATDLDVYGKWVWPNAAAKTDFTAGVSVTIPTGDDTAGLGFNSFSSQLFGGVRHRMDNVVIGGHLGARFNGDGAFQGADLNGKTSYELGVSTLFPLANQVSIVAELQLETDRFETLDASTQLLAGVNWRAFGRGMLRGAVAAGLTSGAPNYRVLVSYAYTF